MHVLTNKLEFPLVTQANKYGMLCIGGDLSTERLQLAYKSGIFPWYSQDEPIVWYSPKERMVLFPDELKTSKSMGKVLKRNDFTITQNQAFEEVVFNCKNIKRNDEYGTWITDEMEQAYIDLHKLGIAKSIEVWKGETLVGGLYGVETGNIFCGESMFSKVSNASKVAFIHLVQNVNPAYKLIDCQIYNDHLASLGAREIPREEFLGYL
jgi:leucyl/phenylalanyl-tRNA--protein transferase